MALTQSERISITQKVIQIPEQNDDFASLKASLDLEVSKATELDNSNANLLHGYSPLINAYQNESAFYDGCIRTELTEQDLLDAANKTYRNYFYPNDVNTALPSIPSGTWNNFVPFSGNKAIGKNYTESYAAQDTELSFVVEANAQISIIEGLVDATRSSGMEVIYVNPNYIKQSSAVMQAAASALVSAINSWRAILLEIYGYIPDEVADSANVAANEIARTSASDTMAVIDDWLTLQDFDITTTTPSNTTSFNAFDASNFDPSKFRADELDVLKAAIAARTAYVPTRLSELTIFLGGIDQDLSTGKINSVTGFYGSRFRFIDMRLNLMTGSLARLRALENGSDAQQQSIDSNNNVLAAYADVVAVSPFIAPGTNTTVVHVADASGFEAADQIFVVSDTQAELSGSIVSKTGNSIKLNIVVPEKYRESEGARLYKVL